MLTKAIIASVAAAAVGVGGATVASANSSSPSSPSAAGKHPARAEVLKRLAAHAVHGSIVTKNKDGEFVTHDLIQGTVSAVSATSITVVDATHKSETFKVASATRVRSRTNGTGSKSTIGAVHKGDHVFVVGTGTTTLTAGLVVDVH
jgi:hypothetical protein